MSVSVECLHCAGDPQCVYWVSGTRGLIVGNFNPDTGELFRHIILEAPIPSSGMFANRKGKPIPLAVGHSTCLTIVKATKQLWVGTENGSKGSLHVFDLPDMKNHHSIHLQDAVLSLLAVNGAPQSDSHQLLCYRVFAGLANGSIIMFSGMHKDKVAQMPLHGARKVIVTKDRGPCLSLVLDPRGRLWYSRGDSVEVIDPLTLQHVAELSSLQVQRPKADLVLPSPTGDAASQKPMAKRKSPASSVSLSAPNSARTNAQLTRKVTISYKPKPDVIIQLAVSPQGVWSVARRSTKLFCWDLETGKQRVAYDIRYVSARHRCSSTLHSGGCRICSDINIMYVCVCTYVCTYVCMYVCTYVCMYVYMYVCMYVYTYVCMYVCIYVCMYVCIYVCMYIYMLLLFHVESHSGVACSAHGVGWYMLTYIINWEAIHFCHFPF